MTEKCGVCHLEVSEKHTDNTDCIDALDTALLSAQQKIEELEKVLKAKDHHVANMQAKFDNYDLVVENSIKASGRIRDLEDALNGLLQYMAQTAESADGPINGVSIEEAHTTSLRFHTAWLKAVLVLA